MCTANIGVLHAVLAIVQVLLSGINEVYLILADTITPYRLNIQYNYKIYDIILYYIIYFII